ncbi:MAG: antitoxin Xre/MbcA/ParS toxin-binding domain-containing protein [Hydrogenophaga sp.]
MNYAHEDDLDAFVRGVNTAPPMQLLETEREGVDAAFLGDMAERMAVSYSYLAETVGIPKATAARKLAKNEKISGAAAIALARLLAIASEIVEDSTAPEAAGFDTAKWLGQWIERPQAALGGNKPSELLDTPTGVAMVTKVLGAIRSGAYQ